MTKKFLDYDIFSSTISECAKQITDEAERNSKDTKIFACINPHSYAVARKDEEFIQALKSADWLVPDGSGIILGAKILGAEISRRVPGPDVFLATMQRLNKTGGRVFFLGSTQDTLDRITARAKEEFPNVTIAGTYSPPFVPSFSAEQNDHMIDAINQSEADILWVGLTAPRQEKWIAQHRDRLNVNVAGAIGAAFDFYAGTVKRSPEIFQKLGLEWLPRLVQQPKRLWRRMFVSAPIFLFDVFVKKIKG